MTAHAVKVQRITKSQPLGFHLFIYYIPSGDSQWTLLYPL